MTSWNSEAKISSAVGRPSAFRTTRSLPSSVRHTCTGNLNTAVKRRGNHPPTGKGRKAALLQDDFIRATFATHARDSQEPVDGCLHSPVHGGALCQAKACAARTYPQECVAVCTSCRFLPLNGLSLDFVPRSASSVMVAGLWPSIACSNSSSSRLATRSACFC